MSETTRLFEHLEAIPDGRFKRGVRHPLHAIVKLILLGLIAGLTNVEHIACFARERWDEIKDDLGFSREAAPHRTTLSRALKKINPQDLETAFEAWVADFMKDKGEFIACVDGKAMRNVHQENGTVAMMVNIFAQDIDQTLAQWPVEQKEGEPTVLAQQLGGLFERYPGLRILTGDAAFAGRDLCRAIVQLERDYVVRIKGNQPAVEEALSQWFETETKTHPADATEAAEKKGRNYLSTTLGQSGRDCRLPPNRTRLSWSAASGLVTQNN